MPFVHIVNIFTSCHLDVGIVCKEPSFPRLFPANTILAVASGKPSDEVSNIIIESLSGLGIQDVRPYIEALNGSMAFAVAPPSAFNDILDLSKWTLTISAGYDKAKAEEIIGMAEDMETHDINVTRLADQTRFNVPGVPIEVCG